MSEVSKLYVGNLNFKTTEDELRAHFSANGVEVKAVNLISEIPCINRLKLLKGLIETKILEACKVEKKTTFWYKFKDFDEECPKRKL